MFESSFGELVLLFIIGLLVLGPQRLPKVAAELGKWVGRARRTATQLRRQLEHEVELSEVIQPPKQPPPPPQTPPASASEPAPSEPAPSEPVAAEAPSQPPAAESPTADQAPRENADRPPQP
jgi:sec-independent protein translocase protein TatB